VHLLEDLRKLAEEEGEDSVLLSPCCHPGSEVQVTFHARAGTMSIACATCGMGVVDVLIAKRRLWSRRRADKESETTTVVQQMDQKSKKNRRRQK